MPVLNAPAGQLRIEYVPLSKARRWDKNCKIHDIPKLQRSIKRHGFRDSPIWDQQLNGGEGGIAGGNGRIEALALLKEQGEPAPLYIATDAKGEWYVPVQFGGDSESEAAAEAFAVDHNNLTLAGFGVDDLMRLWELPSYAATIKELHKQDELPTSVEPEDLSRILESAEIIDAEPADVEATKKSLSNRPKQIKPVLYTDDLAYFEMAMRRTGELNRSKAIMTIFKFFVEHADDKSEHMRASFGV